MINNPARIEEGIAENTVAVMQPSSVNKKKFWSSEIWVMYQPDKIQRKIVSVWRYPGISPPKNAVPAKILEAVKNLIN